MYSKTTKNITVTIEPSYLEEQSDPGESRYVWAYHVIIENRGSKVIQLRSRYWKITDANGIVQEVEGEGVVGEQPLLAPGERYEYTSGTPLGTPGGIMVGLYRMESPDGESFNVDIPAFSLDCPHQKPVLH